MSRRFKFNEHGVCINPDRSAKVGKDTAFIESPPHWLEVSGRTESDTCW